MGNFYRDNKDIENVIDLLDLSEVATLLEEDFKLVCEGVRLCAERRG